MRREDYRRIKQHVGLIKKIHSYCCFEVLMPWQISCLLLTVGVDFNVSADKVKGIQVLGKRITGVNQSRWVMSGHFERQALNTSRMVAKQQFCVSLWTKTCLSEASVYTFVSFLSLITREQTERLNVAERHRTQTHFLPLLAARPVCLPCLDETQTAGNFALRVCSLRTNEKPRDVLRLIGKALCFSLSGVNHHQTAEYSIFICACHKVHTVRCLWVIFGVRRADVHSYTRVQTPP